jgi:glycosyltransferase involved in cell wall biosynthesis
MKNTSFSVIVPVFNVKDYVDKALDSIFAQDYDNFEVIIVDDASTDGSTEKIEGYIARINDKRIKFIKCETNRGLSTVREEGLKFAENEWILFLDSDDWYNEGLFKKLNEVVQNNPDINIIEFAFDCIYENMRRERAAWLDRGVSGIHKSAEENIILAASVWSKCFKRSFLKELNLPPIPRSILDDAPFTVCALLAAEYFYWLNFVGYNYRIRSGSLSRNLSLYPRLICTVSFLKNELKRLNIYNETQFKAIVTCMLGWGLGVYGYSLEYKNFYNECRKIFRSFDLKKDIKTPVAYNYKLYKRVRLYPYWLFKLKMKISKFLRQLKGKR